MFSQWIIMKDLNMPISKMRLKLICWDNLTWLDKYILINYDLTKHAKIKKTKRNITLTKHSRVSALCHSPARDKIRINTQHTVSTRRNNVIMTSKWRRDVLTCVRWKWGGPFWELINIYTLYTKLGHVLLIVAGTPRFGNWPPVRANRNVAGVGTS